MPTQQSKIRRALAALLLLLWGLSGCRPGMPYAALPPIEKGSPLSDSRFLIAALEKRRDAFEDLRALTRVSLQRGKEKVRLKEVLLLHREPRIRIEALGLLGQPFLYLTSDGTEFAIYAANEGRYYRGTLTPEKFERFLGLSLALPQLVAILSGNLPYPVDDELENAWYNADRGEYSMSVARKGGRYRLMAWIDASTLVPTRCAIVEGRAIVLDVTYGDHLAVDGYLLPRQLVVRQPASETVLVAKYEYASLNSGLAATDFDLPVPEGVEVVGVP